MKMRGTDKSAKKSMINLYMISFSNDGHFFHFKARSIWRAALRMKSLKKRIPLAGPVRKRVPPENGAILVLLAF